MGITQSVVLVEPSNESPSSLEGLIAPVIEKVPESLVSRKTEAGWVVISYRRGESSRKEVWLNEETKLVKEFYFEKEEKKVEVIRESSRLIESFFSSDQVYYCKTTNRNGTAIECWYSNEKVDAIRKTLNGKLSCEDGPALVINTGTSTREEHWTDGVRCGLSVSYAA